MPIRVTTHRPDLSIAITVPDRIMPVAETINAVPSVTYPTTAALWIELHKRAISFSGDNDEKWLGEFQRRVPCGHCAQHWMTYRRDNPIDYSAYFEWTVAAHNSVNEKLGKLILTNDQARSLYTDQQK